MAEGDHDSLHSDEALFTSRLLRALEEDEQEALVALLALLGRIFACCTVAVFWPDGRTAAWGKGAAAVTQSALTGLVEPVVQSCLRSGLPQACQTEPSPLLPEEIHRLAYPLNEGAVLYLGQPQRLSELKARRLVQHLACFLAISGRRRDERREAEAHESHLRRLDSTLRLTRRCLEALGEGAPSLATEQVIEGGLAGLREELPYRTWLVLLDGECHGSTVLKPEQREALRELGDALTSARLVETLSSTPYRALASLGESLLAAPLKGGALLLFDDQPFDAHHRATLELLSAYLSVALEQARLHSEAVRAQADLVHANKLAAVGQLAAGLAHELNNPLGSITLALDTCNRFVETNPKVALSVLANAQKAAARAHDIVTKLLHFSRDSRAGQRNCQLAEILDETRAVVEPLLARDGVKLELVGEDPRPLYLNPGEVGQALSNLILNARDALLEGEYEPVVRVSCAPSGAATVVRVRDAGPGIPEGVRERIFEPFFTTKPVGRGTGLGLSLARQMLESQGGRLEIEAVDCGTCFCMTLPRG